MHHHHLLSNITGSQSARPNGSATGASCFAPSAFQNSLTADIFNAPNVANQIQLNYSLSNSLNNTSNNNNNNNLSANLNHQTLVHNSNSNNNNGNSKNQHSHHLGHHRGRHQYLPPSSGPSASLAAINNPQFNTQHSLRNSSPAIKSNHHSFQIRSQPANDNHHHQHHHHHHLASFSNSSSANSSSSSSPSASISPASLPPLTSPQHNGIMGVSTGLAANLHNNHLQLTTANNLQQQANNSNNNTSQQQQNTSRYKTELCRPFEENGTCKYGEKCQFAHGVNELRTLTRHPKYKTEFCRTFHTTGFCPYGPRCHFIHNGKAPTGANSISLNSYTNLPFGQQGSHSISPSSSPISSASTATTANGSVSSASSTVSSSSGSPPSPTNRSLDLTVGSGNRSFELSGEAMELRYIDSYKSLLADSTSFVGNQSLRKNSAHFNATIKSPRSNVASSVSPVSSSSLRNDSEDGSNSPNNGSGCATKTQRLFWLHFHMNESSQCAGELTGSGAARTWKTQA